jgi:hypothetical protein
MSLRFPVRVDGQRREAEIYFAAEREVLHLAYWRHPKTLPKDAPTAQKIIDAVEFAKLASSRWRSYQRDGGAVSSQDELVAAIQKNPAAEIAAVLIARPTWTSSLHTLGFAYLRRTWCHHLFLEFFATHPHVIAKRHEKIGGVGSGLLLQIVSLAGELDIPCIWGEATETSAPWYQEQLALEQVRDHFFIEDDVLRHCQNELNRSQKEMLARRAAL